ncbi:MAG: class I SAM-dependent methyltransferase [Candidatus Andersenbacteria bacterium]
MSSSTGSSKAARWFAHTTFRFWQTLGLHVVPNHYYQPVPDTRRLPESLWQERTTVPGIDLRTAEQLALAQRLAGFSQEFADLVKDGTFSLNNPSLGPVDASVYYGMLRLKKPKQVIEIGAGFSTKLAVQALARNKQEGQPGTLTVIEPYPPAWLNELAGVSKRLTQPVEAVPLETFTALGPGDVLFIDSSHVLKTGSDVQYELLQLLPRLASGVLVHFHDIFIPNEYPRDWLMAKKRFWTEQYGLQAFLACNTQFAVRWAGNYLARTNRPVLTAITAQAGPNEQPGSFWIERIA